MKKIRTGSSRYIFYFFISITLIFGTYKAFHSILTKWDIFSIKTVKIDGNINLEREFLENISKEFLNKNLYSISEDEVLQKYENIIRIKDLSVAKIFPNKLHIEITEKSGKFLIKSIEGDIYTITKDYEILDDNFNISEDLPVISTAISSDSIRIGDTIKNKRIDEIFSLANRIENINPEFAKNVSEYFFNDDVIYIVEVNTGYQIVLGENNLEQKLKRYDIIEQNRTFQRSSIIDLRYEDQLVIRTEDS